MRIGIVGSDNSHGQAFAKLCNFINPITGDYNYPDLRITAIYGHEQAHTEQVAKDGAIETIVSRAEDMIGNIDAAMIIFRHGGLHKEYAMPFIEAGIPVWIDKPFTANVNEAMELVEAAEKKNVIITGGSTVKYAKDVLTLKHAVENDSSLGAVKSGYLNFPGDIKSEYAGIFFYGPHMVEMMLAIYGEKVKSVVSNIYSGELIVIANYERFHVVLNFTRGVNRYIGIVYGTEKTLTREIDISSIYKLGFDEFYKALKNKVNPHPAKELVTPIKILAAIQKSLETKQEILV